MILSSLTTEALCNFKSNIVLNAGNKFIDLEHMEVLKQEFFKDKDVGIEYREKECLIAIQGPNSAKLLQPYLSEDLNKLQFKDFCMMKVKPLGCDIDIYRTGYTGEDGFEISIHSDHLESFTRMLFEETDLAPAGLGARDLLRLEAGLCLHGHEMNTSISPVESLLQWTIRKENHFCDFYGYEALQEIKLKKTKQKRVGLRLKEGGVPREGCELFDRKLTGNRV